MEGIFGEMITFSHISSIYENPAFAAPARKPFITAMKSMGFGRSVLLQTPQNHSNCVLLKFVHFHNDSANVIKIQHFVHHHLTPGERFWPASMPCILRGHTNIPIAQYGSSNLGIMKTVKQSGLANR